MQPCLVTGLAAARYLAKQHELPLIAVNHLDAHIMVSRLQHPDITFPALALLVSGGNTVLALVRDVGMQRSPHRLDQRFVVSLRGVGACVRGLHHTGRDSRRCSRRGV